MLYCTFQYFPTLYNILLYFPILENNGHYWKVQDNSNDAIVTSLEVIVIALSH